MNTDSQTLTHEPTLSADSSPSMVKYWVALLFVFSGIMLLWFASSYRRGQQAATAVTTADLTPPREPLQDFELTDQMANSFSSTSLKGKYWLASFFFSSCPSVCPALNNKIQELQREYAERGLEFVSITCDPANDNPSQLYEYSRRFSANPDYWHFLTGELKYIQRIGADKFQVSVSGLTHTDRLILMGPDGSVVGTYRTQDPVEFTALKKKLNRILAESAPESASESVPATSAEEAT